MLAKVHKEPLFVSPVQVSPVSGYITSTSAKATVADNPRYCVTPP